METDPISHSDTEVSFLSHLDLSRASLNFMFLTRTKPHSKDWPMAFMVEKIK